MMWIKPFIMAVLWVSISGVCFGHLAGDKVFIQADNVRVSDDAERTRIIYYQGVILKSGSLELNAQTLTTEVVNGQIQFIKSEGTPTLLSHHMDGCQLLGQGAEMTYATNEQIITLIGDSRLLLGDAEFTGDSITYHLQPRRVTATGNTKTRIANQKNITLCLEGVVSGG